MREKLRIPAATAACLILGALLVAPAIGDPSAVETAVSATQIAAQAAKLADAADARSKTALAKATKGRGRRGPAGDPGDAGDLGKTGNAGANGRQGTTGDPGEPGESMFGSPLPAGKTVTGVWGGTSVVGQSTSNPAHSELPTRWVITFPVLAPAPINEQDIAFAPGTANSTDERQVCNGTFQQPTAPQGVVCIYSRDGASIAPGTGGTGSDHTCTGCGALASAGLKGDSLDADATNAANTYGFAIQVTAATCSSSCTGAVLVHAEGTWAYTAPAAGTP